MCLVIIAQSDLSDEQARWIEERLSAPEHVDDCGPPKVWKKYQNGLYAIIEAQSNRPIGLVEASGEKDCISPGWWLDKNFRGLGYGTKLVDVLAAYLKSEGYTGVGRIEIQTHAHAYDIASQKLAERFQKHFVHVQDG